MTSDALKLARYQAKLDRNRLVHDDIKGFISHPVVAMIAGCAAVEWLQNNVTLKGETLVTTTTRVPLWTFGLNFGPFKPISIGSRLVTTTSGQPAQMLFSQTLATAIEIAILMWGTKTTVKDVGDVLKTMASLPAQVGTSAAALAAFVK